MKPDLYKLERELGLSKIEECTPVEVEAINRVLAQKKALPLGIFKTNSGKYYKYIDDTFTQEEKVLMVKYKKLKEGKKIFYALLAIIALLAVIGAILAVMVIKGV